MAEAVLFTLTNDILKLAGSNIFSKIQLVRDVSEDLNGLKDTVKTIQALFLDAENKQWDSEQVKFLLMRLKDVLYDIQDLLDDVATEDMKRKVTPHKKKSITVRLSLSKPNQLAEPYKVAKRIQEIRERLDRIKQDRKFCLEELRSEATVAIVRRTTGFLGKEEKIIGRESDKSRIIAYLLDSSSKERVSVVSIVGMGGLGKTTLARLAYNDNKVRNYFKLKMWVCVSDVFDKDVLIKEILKSAQNEYQGDMKKKLQGIENKSPYVLHKLLSEVLSKKRYLLVLDDLWNEDHGKWLELKHLLMDCSLGSKIIVTTRNRSVARATGTKSFIHYLGVLSDAESWDLFKRTAFGDGEESSNQKLEIGQDIVKKCGGVPLAIKTIGNLLYAKEKKEWLHFKQEELSKLDKSNSGILEVLKLSYNHLSPELKYCFAYCALFPKNYVFDKQTMIQLWMAQSFIESSDGIKELEDIGDDYVSDLLCRSFLEVALVDPYTGEVKLFKMHDLMHDLALKVAGNEYKMVSLNKVSLNKVSLNKYTRHVSFPLQSSSSLQEVTSLLEVTKLRTFLSLKRRPSSVQKLSRKEYHGIFSKFKHCRTLVLDYADFCISPSLGSQLTHLRYLDVSENQSIESLPDLMNLQTLKLSKCKNLKTFPKDVWKLVSLRYLFIVGCNSLSHLPPLSELPFLRELILAGLDALELLEQTSDPKQFNTTHVFFPSLERLSVLCCRNLKEWWGGRQLMGAYHRPDNSRSFFPKLSSVLIVDCPHLNFMPPFPHIEYLKIDSKKILVQLVADSDYLSNAAGGPTITPFSKLKLLNLDARGLEHSVLESLFQRARHIKSMKLYGCNLRSLSCGMRYLSSLQELSLCNCEELDLAGQEDNHGTPWRFLVELRVLQITQLPESVALPEGIRYIPNLRHLEISHCRYLKILPQWLENISSLEEVAIINCPSLEDTTMLWRLKAKRKSTTDFVQVTKEKFFDAIQNLRTSGSSSVQIDERDYLGESHLKVAIRILG